MHPALVKRDPEIMSGSLCFSGTRVPVNILFDDLKESFSLGDFLEDFSTVSRDCAVAALAAVLAAAQESVAAHALAA